MSFFVCCRVFCFIVGHCYISLLSSSIHTFIFCLCYLLCKFFSKFLTANCNNLISFDVLQQKWSMVPNLCIWILFLLSNNQQMKTSFSYVDTDSFLFLGICKALCTRVQPGLEQKVVLPRNSYLQVHSRSIIYFYLPWRSKIHNLHCSQLNYMIAIVLFSGLFWWSCKVSQSGTTVILCCKGLQLQVFFFISFN